MFTVIGLEGCPHSAQAVATLASLAQQNCDLRYKVTWVNAETKRRYQSSERPTFPQISFWVRQKSAQREVYLGGNDRLEALLRIQAHLKTHFGKEVVLPLLSLMNCDA